MKKLLRIKIPEWTFPIILLLLCIASFGLLIPQLGFYWDDWAKTLVNRLFGLSGYWDYYAGDRPTSGWTHIVFVSLIGDSPIAWHILTLIFRWLSAWGMWWCLSLLWPKAKTQNAIASLFFVIYPVFTMQAIAVTFHQQWLQYTLFFLSLGFMIQAVKNTRHYIVFTFIGIITLLLQISITEYFAPLEFIRPFVLWFLVSSLNKTENLKHKILTVIKHWAPYLIFLLAFLVWRLFLIDLPNADPYKPDLLFSLFSSPIKTIIELVKVTAVDTLYILLSSWSSVLDIGLAENIPPFTIFSWGVAVLAVIGLSLYLFLSSKTEKNNDTSNANFIIQVFILGLLALLLGCIPAWISGRNVVHDFHSNRYALPAMFGASLIFMGLIEWLIQKNAQKVLLSCLIIGLAVGFHLRTANEYRWLWKDQNRFFWQLSWRAPAIEPGTAIISETEPFPNQGLFSTSAALNLLYPQPENYDNLAYWVYTLYPKYAAGLPDPLEISFNTRFRTLAFQGKTPDTILVFNDQTKGNCVWVINPEDSLNPYLPELLSSGISLSNLAQIKSNSIKENYPPEELFGAEPEHGWCYLYEKADLARQMKDWEQVANLGREALDSGFSLDKSASNSPHEWIPFIEGFSYSGQWDLAEEITFAGINKDPKYTEMYCNLWANIDKSASESEQKNNVFNNIYYSLNCEQFSKQ